MTPQQYQQTKRRVDGYRDEIAQLKAREALQLEKLQRLCGTTDVDDARVALTKKQAAYHKNLQKYNQLLEKINGQIDQIR